MLRPFDTPSQQQCWEVLRHVETSLNSFKLNLSQHIQFKFVSTSSVTTLISFVLEISVERLLRPFHKLNNLSHFFQDVPCTTTPDINKLTSGFCLLQEASPSSPKSNSGLLVPVAAGSHLVVHIWNQWHNRLRFTGLVQGYGRLTSLFPALLYCVDEYRGVQPVSRPGQSVWYDIYFTERVHVPGWSGGLE